MSRIIRELAVKEGLSSGNQSTVPINVIHHDEIRKVAEVELEPEGEKVAPVKPVPVRNKGKAKTKKEENGNSGTEDIKPPRRRRARNGFTPLTESEKRVKQRMLVKRSYYRKIVSFFGCGTAQLMRR
ncbi:unnamed protein product [Phytophthora lilii]|uniref:Unnamed protein product n=1 Tax=Phytophthora lilii TaxID=2077276 RepID=A0A9W6WJM9_9STRA|nr:unnamed protein product [Phytophthora lilii]